MLLLLFELFICRVVIFFVPFTMYRYKSFNKWNVTNGSENNVSEEAVRLVKKGEAVMSDKFDYSSGDSRMNLLDKREKINGFATSTYPPGNRMKKYATSNFQLSQVNRFPISPFRGNQGNRLLNYPFRGNQPENCVTNDGNILRSAKQSSAAHQSDSESFEIPSAIRSSSYFSALSDAESEPKSSSSCGSQDTSIVFEISPSTSKSSGEILDQFLSSYEKMHLQNMCRGTNGSVRMYNSKKVKKEDIFLQVCETVVPNETKCSYSPTKSVKALTKMFSGPVKKVEDDIPLVEQSRDAPVKQSVSSLIDAFEKLSQVQSSSVDEVDKAFFKRNGWRRSCRNQKTTTYQDQRGEGNFVRSKSSRLNNIRHKFEI